MQRVRQANRAKGCRRRCPADTRDNTSQRSRCPTAQQETDVGACVSAGVCPEWLRLRVGPVVIKRSQHTCHGKRLSRAKRPWMKGEPWQSAQLPTRTSPPFLSFASIAWRGSCYDRVRNRRLANPVSDPRTPLHSRKLQTRRAAPKTDGRPAPEQIVAASPERKVEGTSDVHNRLRSDASIK